MCCLPIRSVKADHPDPILWQSDRDPAEHGAFFSADAGLCIWRKNNGYSERYLYLAGGLCDLLICGGCIQRRFYLLGNKKGTIVYVVSILIWAFLYVILRFVAPWEKILAFGRWNLLGIAFAVAIPLLALSYWGCLKIYEKKHS